MKKFTSFLVLGLFVLSAVVAPLSAHACGTKGHSTDSESVTGASDAE